jgi:hypothetical protein
MAVAESVRHVDQKFNDSSRFRKNKPLNQSRFYGESGRIAGGKTSCAIQFYGRRSRRLAEKAFLSFVGWRGFFYSCLLVMMRSFFPI